MPDTTPTDDEIDEATSQASIALRREAVRALLDHASQPQPLPSARFFAFVGNNPENMQLVGASATGDVSPQAVAELTATIERFKHYGPDRWIVQISHDLSVSYADWLVEVNHP